MRTVRVWAWRDSGVANFGDELGPAVLARLGYHVRRVDTIEQADLLTCGSLLEHAAAHARPGTVVWGSGLMHGQPVDVSHLDIRAVRGRLTGDTLDLREDIPVGDPGALVPWLWNRPLPRYGRGVVRHYVDDRDYPWADAVIDATQPVDDVIEAIGSCRRIASSSLHGLIVAAAWGIPTVRLHHPDVAGGDYKFADWLSGLSIVDGRSPLLEALP